MMIDTRKDEDGLHEVKKWPLYLTDDQVATLMDTSSVAWLADEDSWTQVGNSGSCYNYAYIDGQMHSLELLEDGSVEADPVGDLPKEDDGNRKTYRIKAVGHTFDYETIVHESDVGSLVQALLNENDLRRITLTETEEVVA
jgi:hypothetical protein